MKEKLTRAELRRQISYDSSTGIFKWTATKKSVVKGRAVGTNHNRGYRTITINGRFYLAHRLAWFWTFGRWPLPQIDHINGDKKDNRIANLREATSSENKSNAGAQKSNKTGLRGVHINGTRYRAQLQKNGKMFSLGYFDTAQEAHAAYRRAAAQYHGEFVRRSA